MSKILEINNLKVNFTTSAGELQAVRGVGFCLHKGEALAIVGESGCGKSVTAQSVMRLIPDPPGKIIDGRIIFNGQNIVTATEKEMEKIRGREISIIFQDPSTSLNPTMKVGRQIEEVLIKHHKMTSLQARDRSVELLELVEIPNPEKRLGQYPHEFSGGMRQRVMIAIALACNPKVLIADELTTALDVTIQAQIIELMKGLQRKLDTSIILITHNLGIVAGLCTRVLVMYAGQVVEEGPVNRIFFNPGHPYTKGLLKSVIRLDADQAETLVPITGRPPSLKSPPPGCAFWPRCNFAMKICALEDPPTIAIEAGHQSRCWMHYRDNCKDDAKNECKDDSMDGCKGVAG